MVSPKAMKRLVLRWIFVPCGGLAALLLTLNCSLHDPPQQPADSPHSAQVAAPLTPDSPVTATQPTLALLVSFDPYQYDSNFTPQDSIQTYGPVTSLSYDPIGNVTIATEIPEPASLALLGFGGLMLLKRSKSPKA